VPQIIIDIGTSSNSGDGDPVRTAFDKINQNFAQLFESQVNQSYLSVTQASHGFTNNTPVALVGGSWVAADASDATDPSSDAVGIVREVDTDNFLVYYFGYLEGFIGLNQGVPQYLAVGGGLTETPPNGIGEASKAILYPLSSSTALVLNRNGQSSNSEPVP